ncbi:hypothetical protein PP178_04310 [Zeaxanthinibacter sp. PT1]|uniref:hypothetical protein n=1 Tax=Zeaxanthinibacter TaxID=561554 RepID=UPI00234B25B0|nr:hypothetical protein [Zeaxanthinibacter sp. PT1]MDC6350763.1 hypothetical protein [Zeaxanthinibacter sp. PT1]
MMETLTGTEVIQLSISVFVVQLIFIGSRTWNIRAIAEKNVLKVLYTGAVIHLSWLVSVAIGATSMYSIMTNFEWRYLPVVFFSMSGGLLGSYLGLKEKFKK